MLLAFGIAWACLATTWGVRARRSLFRYRRGRLPGSHLYLWVDALAAAATAAAVGHTAGDAMPICLLVPVSLAVVTAAGQGLKLERRK